jgi:hypothetical protein
MSLESCRITIGREGEPLRKITPATVSLSFGTGTRVDGEFQIQPKWTDHAYFSSWLSGALNGDKLRLTIEFDGVQRSEGECWIVKTRELSTSALIGFEIVGTLEPPK